MKWSEADHLTFATPCEMATAYNAAICASGGGGGAVTPMSDYEYHVFCDTVTGDKVVQVLSVSPAGVISAAYYNMIGLTPYTGNPSTDITVCDGGNTVAEFEKVNDWCWNDGGTRRYVSEIGIFENGILTGAIWLQDGTLPIPEPPLADRTPGMCQQLIAHQERHVITGAVATGATTTITLPFATAKELNFQCVGTGKYLIEYTTTTGGAYISSHIGFTSGGTANISLDDNKGYFLTMQLTALSGSITDSHFNFVNK